MKRHIDWARRPFTALGRRCFLLVLSILLISAEGPPSDVRKYFPELVFDDDPEIDASRAKVRGGTLKAMREPSHWSLSKSDPNASVYRFLWLPSFDPPTCVRVSKAGKALSPCRPARGTRTLRAGSTRDPEDPHCRQGWDAHPGSMGRADAALGRRLVLVHPIAYQGGPEWGSRRWRSSHLRGGRERSLPCRGSVESRPVRLSGSALLVHAPVIRLGPREVVEGIRLNCQGPKAGGSTSRPKSRAGIRSRSIENSDGGRPWRR
jgi:hypothetical protein